MTPRSRIPTTGVTKSARSAAASRPRSAKKSAVAAKAPRAPKKKAPVAKALHAPKKKARVTKPPHAVEVDITAPYTLEELVMQALVMELDAAQRYTELADAMQTHNNPEVAALFRKMADIERKHAEQILDGMGWTAMPGQHRGRVFWDGFATPETTPGDAVHYLMQPYHALELALANEQRAERFFGELARAAATALALPSQSCRRVDMRLAAGPHEHWAFACLSLRVCYMNEHAHIRTRSRRPSLSHRGAVSVCPRR